MLLLHAVIFFFLESNLIKVVAIKRNFFPSIHIFSEMSKKKLLHFTVNHVMTGQWRQCCKFLNCICNKSHHSQINLFKCYGFHLKGHSTIEKEENCIEMYNLCVCVCVRLLFDSFLGLPLKRSIEYMLKFGLFQFWFLHSKHVQFKSIKIEYFDWRWQCTECFD